MNMSLLATSLVLTSHVFGQSIIGRARYVQDPAPQLSVLFNTRAYVASLPPMPGVNQLPARIPPEFTLDTDELAEWTALKEANALMADGQPEKASDVYRSYLSSHPQAIPVRVAFADSLFAQKSYREAEQEYQAVLENVPLHFQALNNLAWMYSTSPLPEQQQPELALKLAARARTILPNSHHVWSTLSMAHFQLEQYQKALQHATVALQIAERTQAPPSTLLTYLLHLDKCRMAVEATSILE